MINVALRINNNGQFLSIHREGDFINGSETASKWASLGIRCFRILTEKKIVGNLNPMSHLLEQHDFIIHINYSHSLESLVDDYEYEYEDEDENNYFDHHFSKDQIDDSISVSGEAYQISVQYDGYNQVGGFAAPQARVGLAIYHYLHACFAKNDSRRIPHGF